jgi:acetyltransferase-like isoleucine patch superfamily enzyme
VDIVCDRLELGNGCKIGNNTTITTPDINLGAGCSIGKTVEVELNEYLHLGKSSVVGNRVVIGGQGMRSGEFLWMKNDVIVGGGGCAGPRSYLTTGDNVAIFDKCYINLSEAVTLGDGTALSYNVVLLTHGEWQPALMGYPTKFGPVHVGKQCVVYLNSVVLPGVSIGDYATIGASSLVNKDIPAHSLATGNPARVIKGSGEFPKALTAEGIDILMHEIIADYATTLPPKDAEALECRPDGTNFTLTTLFAGTKTHIVYYGQGTQAGQSTQPDVSISYYPLPDELKGSTHFDINERKMTGDGNAISEDLRDYLRRRAIKIFTGKQFRTIPLANLKRIKEKRKN